MAQTRQKSLLGEKEKRKGGNWVSNKKEGKKVYQKRKKMKNKGIGSPTYDSKSTSSSELIDSKKFCSMHYVYAYNI